MTSIRGRVARGLLQAIGIKRRLGALADVEGDATALREMVGKLRRTDRRLPPWTVRRSWTTDRVDCDGKDLFVMSRRGTPQSRVLLYLHGGGYALGPFGTEWTAMRSVAAETDSDFAVFLYPRAPENDAHTTLQATTSAYKLLLERYGSGNVMVVGTSAGGGLAVALMVSLRDTGRPLPPRSILLSPAVDMTLRDDVSDLEGRDVVLSTPFVRSAGRIYARELGPDHPIVSPINADLGGLPAMHVFVADSEILLPGIESFAETARRAGTEVALILGENAQHTWPIAPTPEGRRALDQVVEIVRAST